MWKNSRKQCDRRGKNRNEVDNETKTEKFVCIIKSRTERITGQGLEED